MFAIATSFTPGPNNAMLLASGVNYGFRRTIPHIAGITVGYAIMFAAVALGVGQFVVERPALYAALKSASVAYLVWLAYRIATATGDASPAQTDRPQSFIEAALFQWINPKGVAAALAASAAYISPRANGRSGGTQRAAVCRLGGVCFDVGVFRSDGARVSRRCPPATTVQLRHGDRAHRIDLADARAP